MFGHLKASDFINALDGLEPNERRARHLRHCASCRDTLAALAEVTGDLRATEAEPFDHDLAQVDWPGLRSSVRDGLLARSVERSSRLQRWSGTGLKPAAAWGLGLVLLVSVVTAGGFWHYRTEHGGGSTPASTGVPRETTDTPALAAAELPDTFDGLAAGDAEAIAWSGADLFSMLTELETGEEEILRRLIAEAAAEATVIDDGVFQ